MSRLLIESGPYESRVALVEEGRVVEVQIEDPQDLGSVGNIYKGRISRVLPGIEAAFVSIGLERDAFLYAGDIQESHPGNGEEEDPSIGERGHPAIDELVAEGDELLVQVVKDALPSKGARITAEISMPGRFVVMLPGSSGVGVSRRLSDGDERERLISVLEACRPEGAGLIARTAAAGRSAAVLQHDLDRLIRIWGEIERASKANKAPALVYGELDLPLRVIRDQATDDLEEIQVDGASSFDELAEYLDELDPELRCRLSLFDEPGRLFESAGVDKAVQRALRGRVWLPSGGYIVINQTEALVAIDINTGRFTGSEDIETTALEVNSEAAVEIARQVRLRDLSGIIVVDFIDMERPDNRRRVLEIFASELEKDRTKVQVSGVSQLGLVEVTRKRSRTDLIRSLTEPCPCCYGRGRLKAPRTVCLEIRRSLLRHLEMQPDRAFHLRLHPRIAEALEGEQSSIREEIEDRVGAPPELRRDASLRPDEFEIVVE